MCQFFAIFIRCDLFAIYPLTNHCTIEDRHERTRRIEEQSINDYDFTIKAWVLITLESALHSLEVTNGVVIVYMNRMPKVIEIKTFKDSTIGFICMWTLDRVFVFLKEIKIVIWCALDRSSWCHSSISTSSQGVQLLQIQTNNFKFLNSRMLAEEVFVLASESIDYGRAAESLDQLMLFLDNYFYYLIFFFYYEDGCDFILDFEFYVASVIQVLYLWLLILIHVRLSSCIVFPLQVSFQACGYNYRFS